MTTKQITAIVTREMSNRNAYRSNAEFLQHLENLNQITQGRSGMFGVPFKTLLPVARKLCK